MADAKKTEEAKKAAYVVAPGAALTCNRKRIFADGAAITADDLDGGQATLDSLIEAKLIVKNK